MFPPAVLLAAAVGPCVAAGAEAVHLHPRGTEGRESLRPQDVSAAIAAVRRTCPGVSVGVSTGLWITGGDVLARRRLVAGWASLPESGRPDFASVNLSEPACAELATVLRDGGIGVEAGVWSTADAEAVVDLDAALKPTRILVEILDAPAGHAVDAAEEVLARLDDVGAVGPRLLHGEGAACWPLVAHAGRRGLPTRIGLEDTLTAPDGASVRDNADLVRLALGLWTTAGTARQD